MTCALCGAESYRLLEALSPYRAHAWTLLSSWHEEAKNLHVWVQACPCGQTHVHTAFCRGEPCRHALAIQPQAEGRGAAQDACDHSWQDTGYLQPGAHFAKEQKVYCPICGAESYREG